MDVRVDIYEKGKLISDDVRYAGHVFTSNSSNNERHHYINFFIPNEEERSIKDGEEYWRNTIYRGVGNRQYDSLVAAKCIIFR